MPGYTESHSAKLGLIASRKKKWGHKFASSLELLPSRVKSFGRKRSALLGVRSSRKRRVGLIFTPLLGLYSSFTKLFNKRLLPRLGLLPTTSKKFSLVRSFLLKIGLAPSSSGTQDIGGISVGSRVYYSAFGASGSEQWIKETSRIKIKLTDAIAGRSRIAQIIVANPQNSKDAIYTMFRRIKIHEYLTNKLIFLGRVTVANSGWDPDLGIILTVVAQDYMYELTTRYVTDNYDTLMTRSEMVKELVTDNTTSGTIALGVDENISPIEYLSRDFSSSNKKCSEVVEELAVDDGVYEATKAVKAGPGFTISIINPPPEGIVEQGWVFNIGYLYFDPVYQPYFPASFLHHTETWSFDIDVPPGSKLSISVGGNDGATTIIVDNLPLENQRVYVFDCEKEFYSGLTTIGCDYRTTDSDTPVFEYFPRGSRPVGGTTNGLTISLTDSVGDQVKRMLSDYNFSSSPKDIITRVIVRGQDSTGKKIEAEAINTTLESQYSIRKEYIDSVYGVTTQAYVDSRAKSLINVYGKKIKRGNCSIVGYPIYKIGSTYYTARAGDLVHVHNTLQNIDQDYLIVSIEYEEPPLITKFELLDVSYYGREMPKGLEKSLSASDIGDLPQVDSASVSRTILFYIPGDQEVGTNVSAEIPIPFGFTCDSVYLRVKTAPVGADLVVDVLLDNVTIFASSKPTILDGAQTGELEPTTTDFTEDSYLSVDIINIGSSTAGADLVVEVRGYTGAYSQYVPTVSPETIPSQTYWCPYDDGYFFYTQSELDAHVAAIHPAPTPGPVDYYNVLFTDGSTGGPYPLEFILVAIPPFMYNSYYYVGSW